VCVCVRAYTLITLWSFNEPSYTLFLGFFFTLRRNDGCTASRRCAFNFLVTVSIQCTLTFRTSYPSINAIQTRLYSAGRAGDWRERTLPSCWRHSGLKRKSNVISFVPGLSSPSSDLPRSFFAYTLTCLLSLPLRFPEYLQYRLSSLSPLSFPLSLSPSLPLV